MFLNHLTVIMVKTSDSNFEQIWKIFKRGFLVLGYGDPISPRHQKWQQRQFKFVFANLFGLILCFLWNLRANWIDHNLAEVFKFGFMSVSVTVLTLFNIFLVCSKKNFCALIRWCETLNKDLQGCLDSAGKKSLTYFKAFAFYIPIADFIAVGIQFLMMTLWNGCLEPPVPVTVPILTNQGLLARIILLANQLVASMTLASGLGLIVGVTSIVIHHFIAVFGVLEKLIKKIVPHTSMKTFTSQIRSIVDLHCILIDKQNNLIDCIAGFMLTYELLCYSLLLSTWTCALFDIRFLFVCITASGTTVPFMFICWMNEQLVDAYENLRITLFDVPWYEMSPQQRKKLLLIMVMVDRPCLLTAGPLHVVSYESTTDMLNRIYSYGLIINNFII